VLIVLGACCRDALRFSVEQGNCTGNAAAKVAVTKALLANCRFACLSFYTNANRWPVALLELTANPNGRVYIVTGTGGLLDSWGRPLIYVAPAERTPQVTSKVLAQTGYPEEQICGRHKLHYTVDAARPTRGEWGASKRGSLRRCGRDVGHLLCVVNSVSKESRQITS
jgi:hypothetical protein